MRPDFSSAKAIKRTLERAAALVTAGALTAAQARALSQLAREALRAIEHQNESDLLKLEEGRR